MADDQRPDARIQDEVRLTLRLPQEVYDAVVKAAARDVRSLNAQIVVALRRAYLDGEKKNGR